jgi:UDP-N-acetylmuramyl pentapeptide synthase
MPRETPTYYPGDRMELQVDIEHRVNFRQVEVVFRAPVEESGAVTRESTIVLPSNDVRVQKIRPDGTKTSVVYFEAVAKSDALLAGVEYELAELSAETVGELAGEGRRGVKVEFDVANIDKPSFRYEDESGQREVAVKRAALS